MKTESIDRVCIDEAYEQLEDRERQLIDASIAKIKSEMEYRMAVREAGRLGYRDVPASSKVHFGQAGGRELMVKLGLWLKSKGVTSL